MATHSSILVWEVPWTEEPGGLQPMGSQSQTRQSAQARWHWRGTPRFPARQAAGVWAPPHPVPVTSACELDLPLGSPTGAPWVLGLGWWPSEELAGLTQGFLAEGDQ